MESGHLLHGRRGWKKQGIYEAAEAPDTIRIPRIGSCVVCCLALLAVTIATGCRFDPVANVGKADEPRCGNGLREEAEQCDGEDLAEQSCSSLGYDRGSLRCGSDCRFDASDCQGGGVCGNGVKDSGEDCDGRSLGSATCDSVAQLSEGTLACNVDCTYDTSGCFECGNGILEAAEACDGTDFEGQTCQTASGKPDGFLTCGSSCQTIGVNHCHDCGDGLLESGEDCDGTAFGGKDCGDYGFSSGHLVCTGTCTIDTSLCSSSGCGDGICSPGEGASTCVQDCGWIEMSVTEGQGEPGHACGIRRDGRIWCWGADDKGQLGDGTHQDSPLPIPLDVRSSAAPISVACGGRHTCALFDDGRIWCWGLNDHGQLGVGPAVADASAPLPIVMPDNVAGFAALDVGVNFSCALDQSQRVWCWGTHDRHVLGIAGNTDALSPVHSVSSLDGRVTVLSLGAEHACVLATDGSIWCWGRDHKGQLGDGQQGPDRFQPEQVVGGDSGNHPLNATAVTAGGSHTCALDSANGAWCWGLDDHGQLGDGSNDDSAAPLSVDQTTMGGVLGIFAGPQETCALDTGNGVWCWGLDDHGQVGTGQASGEQLVAVAHQVLNSGIQQVAVGPGFVCALDGQSRLWCWGLNDKGQLGNGTQDDSYVPSEVLDP